MISKGIIKSGHVIFLYSKPPERALIGYVENVNYPEAKIRVIPRSVGKNKFGNSQKIDLSKNIPLSIMDEDFIEDYMTPKERKALQEIKKEDQIIDLFAGEY